MEKKPSAQPGSKQRSGFSLVLSLAVMAMILIMVISLTAFLTVSLKISETYTKRAQACQNAILGMKIALGQLQGVAGPDRRATAPAMIMDPTISAESSGTQQNPQWIGVWSTYKSIENNVPKQYFGFFDEDHFQFMKDLRKEDNLYKKPKTRNWLVSQRKEDLQNPTFGPDTPSEPDWIALLQYKDPAGNSKKITTPYVKTTDKISNAEIGGYAYWISDESTKARINIEDPYKKEQYPATKAFNRILAPAFSNIAAVKSTDDQTNTVEKPYVNFGKDFVTDHLNSVITLKSAALLDFNSISSDKKERYLKNNFLDLTTSSKGLLINTIKGRFLADMTAFLHKSNGIINEDTQYNLPGLSKSDPIIRSEHYVDCSPCYGALSSWYDIRKKMPDVASAKKGMINVIAPKLWSGNTAEQYEGPTPRLKQFDYQAITPVITECSWALNFARVPPVGGNGKSAYTFNTYIYPKVSLWNPYNVTIRGQSYAIMMYGPYDTTIQVQAKGNAYNARPGSNLIGINLGDKKTGFLLFTLDPIDIPPGEVVVFSAPQGYNTFDTVNANRLSPYADPAAGAFVHRGKWTLAYQPPGDPKPPTTPYCPDDATDADDYGFSEGNVNSCVGDYFGAVLKLASGSVSRTTVSALPTLQRVNTSWGGERVCKEDYRDTHFWYIPQLANKYNGNPFLWDSSKFESTWIDPPRSWQFGTRTLQIHDDEGLVTEDFGFRKQAYPAPALQVAYLLHNLRSPLPMRNPFAYIARVYDNATTNIYIWPKAGTKLIGDFKNMPTNDKGYYRGSPFGKNGLWANTVDQYVLFDLPYSDLPLLSLGSFRNAMLSPFIWHPSHVIGNSNASPYSDPDKTLATKMLNNFFDPNSLWDTPPSLRYPDWRTRGSNNHNILNEMERDRYLVNDFSYIANKELFDNYYASALLSQEETASKWDGKKPLPNARLKLNMLKKDVQKQLPSMLNNLNSMYHTSASMLVNEGAFNINSTSVEAWKGFLSTMLNVPRYLMDGTTIERNASMFSKQLIPFDGTGSANQLTSNAMWSGFRALNADEASQNSIDKLAKAIVEEIKIRGPFMSPSDFINRRLVGTPASPDEILTKEFDPMSQRGTLDAAILRAGINQFSYQNQSDSSDSIDKKDVGNAKKTMFSYVQALPDYQSQNAPGYLTQGEILQALAPAICVRGDTFVIRTYGDCKNQFTGNVESEAYLEVTVQRLPDYVDETNDANIPATILNDKKNDMYIENAALSAINKTFGRKFAVTSVRWITKNDI